MKKYYAYFTRQDNGQEYVVRFKIKGSLRYDYKGRCFVDKDYYVRSVIDVVNILLQRNKLGFKTDFALILDHNYFVECRASGTERFEVDNEVIKWDAYD